ncbi:MAG: MBL fold metallo-hydrolase [Bacteroidales bacterium]|nr:MBL fold metallo-hydrolase [Bacteroidales bacterium]
MMIRIYTFQFNPFQECCSLVWDKSGEAVIIDPGFYNAAEAETLYRKIESENLVPKMILLTHGHFDHIFGVKECAVKYGIPVMMNRADNIILENDGAIAAAFGLRAPDVDFDTLPLEDGQTVPFGETVFRVIATPGHTPGGVCFYDEADKVLFSGDTLFAGSIGRTDNAWGDYDSLIKCIMEKLMGLDGDVSVIPGHGPQTNIGRERTHNPFLQPFNEPEPDELDWNADGIELRGGEL